MVSVSIQVGATFAFVFLMAINDWEPQFELYCHFEGVVLDAVCASLDRFIIISAIEVLLSNRAGNTRRT